MEELLGAFKDVGGKNIVWPVSFGLTHCSQGDVAVLSYIDGLVQERRH